MCSRIQVGLYAMEATMIFVWYGVVSSRQRWTSAASTVWPIRASTPAVTRSASTRVARARVSPVVRTSKTTPGTSARTRELERTTSRTEFSVLDRLLDVSWTVPLQHYINSYKLHYSLTSSVCAERPDSLLSEQHVKQKNVQRNKMHRLYMNRTVLSLS